MLCNFGPNKGVATDEVIQNATNRFVHVMDLDLLDATAQEIQASLIKYVK